MGAGKCPPDVPKYDVGKAPTLAQQRAQDTGHFASADAEGNRVGRVDAHLDLITVARSDVAVPPLISQVVGLPADSPSFG